MVIKMSECPDMNLFDALAEINPFKNSFTRQSFKNSGGGITGGFKHEPVHFSSPTYGADHLTYRTSQDTIHDFSLQTRINLSGIGQMNQLPNISHLPDLSLNLEQAATFQYAWNQSPLIPAFKSIDNPYAEINELILNNLLSKFDTKTSFNSFEPITREPESIWKQFVYKPIEIKPYKNPMEEAIQRFIDNSFKQKENEFIPPTRGSFQTQFKYRPPLLMEPCPYVPPHLLLVQIHEPEPLPPIRYNNEYQRDFYEPRKYNNELQRETYEPKKYNNEYQRDFYEPRKYNNELQRETYEPSYHTTYPEKYYPDVITHWSMNPCSLTPHQEFGMMLPIGNQIGAPPGLGGY